MAELQTGDPKNVPSWIPGVKIVGHCKDCKHFDARGSVKANWGICDLGYASGYGPHLESTLAFAAGEGDGELYVSPDFGCIQFEAKESK